MVKPLFPALPPRQVCDRLFRKKQAGLLGKITEISMQGDYIIQVICQYWLVWYREIIWELNEMKNACKSGTSCKLIHKTPEKTFFFTGSTHQNLFKPHGLTPDPWQSFCRWYPPQNDPTSEGLPLHTILFLREKKNQWSDIYRSWPKLAEMLKREWMKLLTVHLDWQ